MAITKNRLGIEDQCKLIFETKKGNSMLFTFMHIPENQKRPVFDCSDYVYELMNAETGEKHLMTGEKYDNYVKIGYFHSIRQTKRYEDLIDVLAKESMIKVVYIAKDL
jgi:hypothetical protein